MVKQHKPTRGQREKVAQEEFQQSLVAQRKESEIQAKPDDELFAFDTLATSERKKRKRDPSSKPQKPQAKSKDFPKFQAPATKVVAQEEVVDLWGGSQKATKNLKTKARFTPSNAKPVASHPGISYNPQTGDHQDIVAEAVAVELRRAEAKQMKDPLWAKVKNQNIEQLSDDEEEDLSDSESEEESDSETPRKVERRVNRGKLTRAELNRRKRHRELTRRQHLVKKNQQLLAEIGSAKKINKELALQESQTELNPKRPREETISSLAETSNKLMSYNAHTKAPEVTVPLSDELTGSLRTLKTKNSVLLEQIAAKQFALDPHLKVKRMIKPDAHKKARKIKNKLKVKTTPRYYTE